MLSSDVYVFNNFYEPRGFIDTSLITEDNIINEPMLYGFSITRALNEGGPIVQAVLRHLMSMDDWDAIVIDNAQRGYHPVIDTKSVLLMPGQYPCIPGWHCDGVLRQARGGQPNLDTLNEEVDHFLMTGSATEDHQGTEVIDTQVGFGKDLVSKASVWRDVDALVREHVEDGLIDETENGEVLRIQRSTLHRGLPAKERGWRFFFRLSFYHMPAVNEIRKQVNVYTDINNGW